MDLVTTMGDLRTILSEVEVVNPETGEVWQGGWVWDAWLEFVPLWKDDQADLSGFSAWLESHGLPHKKTNYVAQIIGDSLQRDTDTVLDEGSDDWDELAKACEFASKTKFKPSIVPIVVGRNPDGSLRWKKTKMKVDFDGTVVGDEHGEPIWAFDPETLVLYHIPTFRELQLFNRDRDEEWMVCARLCDIEGGKI